MNQAQELRGLLPKNKKPVLFVCIGSDRSTGDSLGPLVGTKLKEMGYNVLGTLEEPVHAVNLEENINLIKEKYPNHFVVGVDACLGRSKRVGKIGVKNGPIKPGAGINKELPPVGDIGIYGIVNVSGFMEFFVLGNTRLYVVMKMADEIVRIIEEAMNMPYEQAFKPKVFDSMHLMAATKEEE